jgi:hypothetical protein
LNWIEKFEEGIVMYSKDVIIWQQRVDVDFSSHFGIDNKATAGFNNSEEEIRHFTKHLRQNGPNLGLKDRD